MDLDYFPVLPDVLAALRLDAKPDARPDAKPRAPAVEWR